MAKPYTITIKDGTGTAEILNDTYQITTETAGYNNSSIDPKTITVDDEHTSYSFKVSAQGNLEILITEDGTVTGTPIVGATIVRCDKSGTAYGTPIVTNTSGIAIFNNVPFVAGDGVFTYYRQTASDGSHNFDGTLKNIALRTESERVIIANPSAATKTINLTDQNYEGLPIENGQITLS